VNLTTHVHPLPRSRMVELYLDSIMRLRDIVLNLVQRELCLLFLFHGIEVTYLG
jgi:hypothetical protein